MRVQILVGDRAALLDGFRNEFVLILFADGLFPKFCLMGGGSAIQSSLSNLAIFCVFQLS